MVSLPRLFRRKTDVPADPGIDVHIIDDTLEHAIPWQRATTETTRPVDPVSRAMLARIALVTVEENVSIPALMPDEPSRSRLVQRVMLPRNPRIAGEEVYELDGMDMLVIVSGNSGDHALSRDMMRWLKLLKPLNVPMLVLLPHSSANHQEHDRIAQFSHYVGLPVVTAASDNIEQARQDFLLQAMEIAPATALALAAHMPNFRLPLVQQLVKTATEQSLRQSDEGVLKDTRQQLMRQICAAYGCNGQHFDQHRAALDTLLKSTAHYTGNFVRLLPIRNQERRRRLTESLITLLTGHTTAMYLGAQPPSIRKELLPQVWRLYRASGKPISA